MFNHPNVVMSSSAKSSSTSNQPEQHWYAAGQDEDASGSARLEETYQSAQKQFGDSVIDDTKRGTTSLPGSTIEDVQKFIVTADENYWRTPGRKPNQWLERVAKSLTSYGRILNILAQHHPEYVALVWAAMKALLEAVINHEYLIDCITKAIALIGEALPQSLLFATLYPTGMSRAVRDLCAYILAFFIRAHRWYTWTTSRKAISSIIRPAELKYDDLLDEIQKLSQDIDPIREISWQARMRDSSLRLETISKQLETTSKQLQASEPTFQELERLMGLLSSDKSADKNVEDESANSPTSAKCPPDQKEESLDSPTSSASESDSEYVPNVPKAMFTVAVDEPK